MDKWNEAKILEFVQSLDLDDSDYPLCYNTSGMVLTMKNKVLYAGCKRNAKMIVYTGNKLYYSSKQS